MSLAQTAAASPGSSANQWSGVADRRVAAVLNRRSRGYRPKCEQQIIRLLDRAGVRARRVLTVEPQELAHALRDAAGWADILVALGGDGTIAAAAEACGPDGPALVALPGGTMNVLVGHLGGVRAWPKLLRDTLRHPRVRRISGGRADGRLFLVSAILGSPASWGRVREALRARRFGEAWRLASAAFARSLGGRLSYEFPGRRRAHARAVAVRCPLASAALDDDAGVLEAAALSPRSTGEVFRLGVEALIGQWRKDPSIVLVRTDRLWVGRRAGVDALLDGETVSMGPEVRVEFVPFACKVLVPAA